MRIPAGKETSCSRLIVAVFVLVLSGCAAIVSNSRDYSGQPLSPSVTELKVLTYNIRLAAGRYEFARDVYELPWGKNISAVVAAIESADADVVALQEVAGPGQAKKLAKALNMNFAYEGHQTGGMRASWWGVAILSKFPILEARGTAISHGRGNTKHIVVAKLDIGGKPCTFVSIHKDKDLYDGSSVRNILAAVADVHGPVVLAGDFNIQPGDARLEMLSPRFIDTATAVDTPASRRATSLGTGFGRIDYVLSQSSSFEVIDAGLIAKEHDAASDHFGYWARLAFR